MPPRLARVGGYIRNSTSNAHRRNSLAAFSFHPEDVQRNLPLAKPFDRNLKFNLPERRKRPREEKNVPDDEWELRVGRGIDVLAGTLPSFFEHGLMINSPLDHRSTQEDSIYSKMIELSYTPPAALPSPLPQTLRFQGLALYQASAAVLRSTFTALYSDCSVSLERMAVIPGGYRERKVKIEISLQGTSRLSSTKAEWSVLSMYSFSPCDGLILKHEIERIHPTPHSALIDSVRAMILRLMGIRESESPSTAVGGLRCAVRELHQTRCRPHNSD